MPSSLPQPLPENNGLVFVGETLWPPAQLTARQTKALSDASNPTSRPNVDVIRNFISVSAGQIEETSQIDFPAHFTEQEASLYLKPFAQLQRAMKSPTSTWWLNPHANSDLRTAIARLDRYLASPLDAEIPAWDWIESERLPTSSLLIVARDDDFIHGVLQSRFFQVWWQAWSRAVSPTTIVQSFPFPWAPTTLLSALNRTQEEHRLAIARAARTGAQDQLNEAVASSYNCSGNCTDDELATFLKELNATRSK